MYKACVLVISDKEYTGEVEESIGKDVVEHLKVKGLNLVVYRIVPEIKDIVKDLFVKCCDEYEVELVFIIDPANISNEVIEEVSEDSKLSEKNGICFGKRNKSMLIHLSNENNIDIEKSIKLIEE